MMRPHEGVRERARKAASTLNPKVAGSIPARPIGKSLQATVLRGSLALRERSSCNPSALAPGRCPLLREESTRRPESPRTRAKTCLAVRPTENPKVTDTVCWSRGLPTSGDRSRRSLRERADHRPASSRPSRTAGRKRWSTSRRSPSSRGRRSSARCGVQSD